MVTFFGVLVGGILHVNAASRVNDCSCTVDSSTPSFITGIYIMYKVVKSQLQCAHFVYE